MAVPALFTAKQTLGIYVRIDFPRVFLPRRGLGENRNVTTQQSSGVRARGSRANSALRRPARAGGRAGNSKSGPLCTVSGYIYIFFSGRSLTGVAVVLQVVSGCALHNRIVEADRRGERHCSAVAALSCPRRPRGPAHPNTHAGLIGYVDAQTGRTS